MCKKFKKILSFILISILVAPALVSVTNAVEDSKADNKANVKEVKLAVAKEPVKEFDKGIIEKYSKSYKLMNEIKNVPKDKELRIRLSKPLDDNNLGLFLDGIVVIDSKGVEQKLTSFRIMDDKRTIYVCCPNGGYAEGERYALIINGKRLKENCRLKEDVIQYFSVRPKDYVEGNPGTVTVPSDSKDNKDEKPIEIDFAKVLSDYRGGRTDFERKNYKQKELEGNVYKYKKWEYKNIVKAFDEKYRNKPEYAFITDPQYYMKMPNITIKYDKVNTDMKFKNDYFGLSIDNGNTIDEGHDRTKFTTCDTSDPVVLKFNPEVAKIPYQFKDVHQFIWRPDVEQETVDYINKLRKEKGLKPLKVNNDLTSIAKFAAARNFMDSSVNNDTKTTMSARVLGETFYFPNDGRIVGVRSNNKVKSRSMYCEWIDGIPCAFKDESKNKKYLFQRCETKDVLRQGLNYNKNVNFFCYDSFLWSNGKELIDFFLKGDMESKKVSMRGNSMDCYDKDIRDIIFKKDITEIGIGSTYALPHNILELNGQLGITIMTQ